MKRIGNHRKEVQHGGLNFGLPGPTSLLRDRSGRPILPPLKALDDNRGPYHFSDADLAEIYWETRRRRRLWRVRQCVRLGLVGLAVAWLFFLIHKRA